MRNKATIVPGWALFRPSHWAPLLLSFWLAGAQAMAESGTNAAPQAIATTGLHNVFSIEGRYFSGNAPESDEAFASLKKLGIKTIISVDGSMPDIAAARRFGLDYIHLPFGYGGIPETNVVQLIKAAQTQPGPIYVHCHHGLHRGPAAVAVICEGTLGWSTNEAVAWMHAAGTSADYPGLYKAAADFHTPSQEQLAAVSAHFPEVSPQPGLVEAMVAIDKHWDLFKALQKNKLQPSGDGSGKELASEAVLLWEAFRELQRTGEAKGRGDDFVKRLSTAETAMADLKTFFGQASFPLQPDAAAAAAKALSRAGQSCQDCHKQHRN